MRPDKETGKWRGAKTKGGQFGTIKPLYSNTIKITSIPPNYTYERYEEILNLLMEKGIIIAYDDNYLYICVSNNNWRRVAIATW